MAEILSGGMVVKSAGISALSVEKAADTYRNGVNGDRRSQELFAAFAAANPRMARVAIDFAKMCKAESNDADLMAVKSAKVMCPACGKKAGGKFCPRCGADVLGVRPDMSKRKARARRLNRLAAFKAGQVSVAKAAHPGGVSLPYALTPDPYHDNPVMREAYWNLRNANGGAR